MNRHGIHRLYGHDIDALYIELTDDGVTLSDSFDEVYGAQLEIPEHERHALIRALVRDGESLEEILEGAK